MSAEHSNQKYCPGYRVIPSGIGAFLNDNGAAVTAIGAISSAVATFFIALFTLQLWRTSSGQFDALSQSVEVARKTARAAKRQRRIASKQNKLTKSIERAYVKMSHEPPGIEFRGHTVWGLHIKVTNHGRTPAEVTDAHAIGLYLRHNEQLPREPDYQRSRGEQLVSRAFLVTNDHFWFATGDNISRQRKEDILNGRIDLYVLGYVDYTDQFGTKHRAGYARLYVPELDVKRGEVPDEQFAKRSNLVLVTQPGYNYDRVRGPNDVVFERTKGVNGKQT